MRLAVTQSGKGFWPAWRRHANRPLNDPPSDTALSMIGLMFIAVLDITFCSLRTLHNHSPTHRDQDQLTLMLQYAPTASM